MDIPQSPTFNRENTKFSASFKSFLFLFAMMMAVSSSLGQVATIVDPDTSIGGGEASAPGAASTLSSESSLNHEETAAAWLPASSLPGPGEGYTIVQMISGDPLRRFYPSAIPSLIDELNRETTLSLQPDPLFIDSFADPRILQHPFIYVNAGDYPEWDLPMAERENLRRFLDRGGFLFLDAGINAAFLRSDVRYGQSHSFAEWQVTPVIEELFTDLFPQAVFSPLPRNHPIFSAYYAGLPPAESLPEAIRDYVVNEKWPQGSYSFMGLYLDGRLAVLVTPILSMGWGRDELGRWTNPIGFRVREGAEGLSERLSEAAYSGELYPVLREDGLQDMIYCQPEATPAWVQEPSGRYRLFRYYNSLEISEYAHTYFTRLGVNIFVYASSR